MGKVTIMEVDETNPVPKSLNPYIKLYKLNVDVYKHIYNVDGDGRDAQTVRVLLDRITVYECKQCYFCYTTVRDYKLHVLKHAEPIVRTEYSHEKHGNYVKKFKCEECDRRFVAKSTLVAHSVVHQPFPYHCHCGIGYNKRDDLAAHKRLVHPEMKQEKVWQPITSYTKKKIKSEHCIKSVYITPQSDAIKTEFGVYKPKRPPATVQKKRKKKSGQKRNYTGVSLPYVGYETATVDGKTKYVCLTCNKQLSSYKSLQFHNLSHTGEKPFKCNMCDKSYTQSGNLKVHKAVVHDGVKVECPVCKKLLNQKSAVDLHMRTHTGEKPYKCDCCGKEFADPSAFGRHVRIHTGDKRYKCLQCPMRFTDASGLIMHRRRHAGIKNFKCEICERKFYTIHDLKKHVNSVHLRRHTCECDYCGKRFAMKGNLVYHIKKYGVHSGFKCELCPRTFSNMHQKEKHIKIHKILENNDYVCDICGESFDRKVSIAKHLKMEH